MDRIKAEARTPSILSCSRRTDVSLGFAPLCRAYRCGGQVWELWEVRAMEGVELEENEGLAGRRARSGGYGKSCQPGIFSCKCFCQISGRVRVRQGVFVVCVSFIHRL